MVKTVKMCYTDKEWIGESFHFQTKSIDMIRGYCIMGEKLIGLCIAKIKVEEHWRKLKAIQEKAVSKGYRLLTYYIDDMDFENRKDALEPDMFPVISCLTHFEHLEALLIDAEGIEAQEVLDIIAGQAVDANVPLFVWHGIAKGAVELNFVMEHSVKRFLQYFKEKYGYESVTYVSGTEEEGLTGSYYRNYLMEQGIHDGKISHMPMRELKKVLPSLSKEDLSDVYFCENENVANYVCHQLGRNGYQVPDDVMVACCGEASRAQTVGLNFTVCFIDYMEFIGRILDLLEKKEKDVLEEKRLREELATDDIVICRDMKYTTGAALLTINTLYQNLFDSMLHEQSFYGLTDHLLKTNGIEEIADVLSKYMLRDSVFCVKDSFMQDIFSEGRAERWPRKGEKYFILADTREHPGQWTSFLLGEPIPGLEKDLGRGMPLILTPVRYLHQHFGYLIFCAEDYDNEYYKIDRVVHNFGRVLARYTVEKRLTFVNNMLVNANENMKKMQHGDILTGMLNAEGFSYELTQLVDYCRNHGEELLIGCIDIDRLSNINDVYGHSEGDHAIKAVAQILQQGMSDKAICARLGTDEFVIASYAADGESVAEHLVDKLAGLRNEYNRISGKEYTIELNYGYISVKPDQITNEMDLLDEVFAKKNVQKNSKRSQTRQDSVVPQEEYSREDHETVKDIMDKNLFLYAFQPIVSARTGEIYAYEALMRSPKDRPVSPLTILKYATIEKRLYHIEYATLNNVFKLVHQNRDVLNGKKIFVNSIPGYFLKESDFDKLKHKYKDIFDNVVIEVTEQTESDDGEIGILLGRSDSNGFEVAIDDFGTGYSNTVNLLKYLPNYVKIDRMLISDIHQEPKKQHFVKNIIEFAHDNGFMALAEGVETLDELKALIRMDVDLIQGFYTARPSFEIAGQISEARRAEIMQANQERYETFRKRVYLAANDPVLNLMQLALKNYTGIVVAEPEVKIVGNPDFVASVSIKIKENTHCRLTLSEARLRSCDGSPCIDVGEGATLTLVTENENELLEGGIRVPESASLILEGTGTLEIRSNRISFYGIGNDENNACGQIENRMSGTIKISCNSNVAIGIGGRTAKALLIHAGKIILDMNAGKGIGIGVLEDETPIELMECNLAANIAFTEGTVVGSWRGTQNFKADSVGIEIHGTGNELAGFGTLGSGTGNMEVKNAGISITLSGKKCLLVGNHGGGLKITSKYTKFTLQADGRECLGIGSFEEDAAADLESIRIEALIRCKTPVFLGIDTENSRKEDVVEIFSVE